MSGEEGWARPAFETYFHLFAVGRVYSLCQASQWSKLADPQLRRVVPAEDRCRWCVQELEKIAEVTELIRSERLRPAVLP